MRNFVKTWGLLLCLLILQLSPLTASASEAPSLRQTKIAARTEIWKAIKSGSAESASIAVMENGRLVYSEGFGMADREGSIPVDGKTIFNMGSISKLYAATAVMLLVDDGRVNLDQPVITYLPEFSMADGRYRDITVRMLLNHSSGLPGTVGPNSFGFEYHEDFYKDVLEIFAKSNLKHRPGEMAPYCNDGFTLAEMLVAKVSGENYLRFLETRIFKPLSLKNTGDSVGRRMEQKGVLPAKYYTQAGKSEPLEVLSLLGSGGLSASPSDLCRFADSFSPGGFQILSKSSLIEMKREQPNEFSSKLRHPGISFGLGWDVTEIARYKEKGLQVLGKSGGTGNYSSMLYTIPDKRISVAIIAAGPKCNSQQIADVVLDAYLNEIGLVAKKSRVVEIPVKPQQIPAEMNTFEGYYTNGDALLRIAFNLQEGVLVTQELIGAAETRKLSAVYHDGYFYGKSSKVYFAEVDGRRYFVANINDSFDTVVYQKIEPEALPQELRIAMEGRRWIRRNVKAYTGSIDLPGHMVTSRQLKELPGYVDFDGIKKITSPTSAGMAVHALRDLTEVIITEKAGEPWIWLSGLVYSSTDAVKTLENGPKTVVIGREGFNEWLVLSDDTVLSFRKPEKGRIVLFDPEGTAIYDSAVDQGEVYARAGSFVEMAANVGDFFSVTATAIP